MDSTGKGLSYKCTAVQEAAVEKMAISAPVGGKISYQRANERAVFPDSRTYFNFSLSQKLTRGFWFLYF